LQANASDDYKKLAEIICKYSRQVIWVVTEIVPGVPPVTVPYSVQIQ